MTRDQYMEEVFLKPPLVAYRRPRNLRDMLVRAKLPDRKHQRPRREVTGMRKCQNCPICPLALVKAGNKIRSTSSKYVHEVRGKFDCQTENICYVVFCKKKGCSLHYIGESKHTAQHRWSQQRLRDRARQSGNWRTFQLQRSQSGRHGVLHLRNIQERSPPP